MAKTVSKNPGRAFENGVNAFQNPMVAVLRVMTFFQSGKDFIL